MLFYSNTLFISYHAMDTWTHYRESAKTYTKCGNPLLSIHIYYVTDVSHGRQLCCTPYCWQSAEHDGQPYAACFMHYCLKMTQIFSKWWNTNPKENVFGGVEASCVNTGSVGGAALTNHPAGKARDGAGCNWVLTLFWSSWCICHHKVYGALSGTANLETRTNKVIYDSFRTIHWIVHFNYCPLHTMVYTLCNDLKFQPSEKASESIICMVNFSTFGNEMTIQITIQDNLDNRKHHSFHSSVCILSCTEVPTLLTRKSLQAERKNRILLHSVHIRWLLEKKH